MNNNNVKGSHQKELYNEVLSSEEESKESDEHETANNSNSDHKVANRERHTELIS